MTRTNTFLNKPKLQFGYIPSSVGPSFSQNFTTNPSTAGYNFSRASSGTYFDATGTLQTAANDVARFDYNPAGNTARGLLLESARTNYLLNSTVPVTQVTGSLPTGTYTLWLVGTGSVDSSAATAVGSNFGTATAGSPNIFTITTAGTVSITVTGTPTRFQLENGNGATSFITTTAATATRAVDICTMTNLAGLGYNATQGTFIVIGEVRAAPAASGNGKRFMQFDDNSEANYMSATMSNGTSPVSIGAFAVTSTVTTSSNGPLLVAETQFKMAFAYQSGNNMAAFNGTLLNANAPYNGLVTLPAIDRMRLGNASTGARSINGWIRSIAYYPTRLPDATIASMTT